MKRILIFGAILVSLSCSKARAMDYHWTAPSDNVKVVRYEAHRTCDLDSLMNHWKQCPLISNLPIPANAGQRDSVIGVQVPVGKRTYMCIRAYDFAGNESWCSNIDSTYVPDTEPPTQITDLTGMVR
jgi:hypothetical protein